MSRLYPEKLVMMQGKTLKELIGPLLREGRCCRFVSGGSSMHPLIMDRDCITLAPLEGKKLAVGDVVACFPNEPASVIIHRVIAKKNTLVLVKGDNCMHPDGWISRDHIGGILIGVERNGRPVRLGLGSERKLIAMASRHHRLMRILTLPLIIRNRLLRKTV